MKTTLEMIVKSQINAVTFLVKMAVNAKSQVDSLVFHWTNICVYVQQGGQDQHVKQT